MRELRFVPSRLRCIHDKDPDRQSEYDCIDDRNDRRGRARRRRARHRNIGRDVRDGTGLDRGILRRGLRRSRPDPGARQHAGCRCGDHRLFRRYRARCRANGSELPGGRHLRGGAGDRGTDCKTDRRRHHAAALDRAARRTGAALWLCRAGARHRLRRRGARSRKARLGCGGKARSRDRPRARQGRGGNRAGLRRHGRSSAETLAQVRRSRRRRRGGRGEAGRGARGPEAHDVPARVLRIAGREALHRDIGAICAEDPQADVGAP